MRHEYLNDVDVKNCLMDIIRQMYIDGFKPDVVVGLVRGGSVPANLLSQFLDIPCYMVNKDEQVHFLPAGNNVLVIDDINDSGSAMTEISNYFTHEYDVNFKYATLISNEGSSFEVNYYSIEINKIEEDVWIVFPWENWWMANPDGDLY
jgi:hypoxanthine phosphoribosyltransferase